MLRNIDDASRQLSEFVGAKPFDHCVIDNFFDDDTFASIVSEFPSFSADVWHEYNNPLEIKKTCNNWNAFPKVTYSAFSFFNSNEFISLLERTTGISPLYGDSGLNGGGWHTHSSGGRLNPHLDYSVHPKINRQRVLNLLIYVTPDWEESWGGKFGLWGKAENKNGPGELLKTITPKPNRAVIFNTTQDSWHGLADVVSCPSGICRNSLAAYYLTEVDADALKHNRAIFAPVEDQIDDPEILKLIEKRSNYNTSAEVYRASKNK